MPGCAQSVLRMIAATFRDMLELFVDILLMAKILHDLICERPGIVVVCIYWVMQDSCHQQQCCESVLRFWDLASPTRAVNLQAAS